jgi:hypothetical protein
MCSRVDAPKRVKYTRAVRRGLAVLIALSLGSLQGQALAFHVHAVPDHPEERNHQHGPAIHNHGDGDFDRELRVEPEDATAHSTVITVAVPVATASASDVVCAEFAEALPAPGLQLIGDVRAIDVRSHGPPPARNAFLRGPPTSNLL